MDHASRQLERMVLSVPSRHERIHSADRDLGNDAADCAVAQLLQNRMQRDVELMEHDGEAMMLLARL